MDGSMSRKKSGFWLLPVLVLALLAAALLLFSRPGDRVTVHLMTLEGEEQLSAVRGGALRLAGGPEACAAKTGRRARTAMQHM